MVIACIILMDICLVTEGLILLFSGFPLPRQPLFLYAVGTTWACTSLSMLSFRKRPAITLILGCLLLLVNAYDLWFHTNEEKSIPWFLYQHSIELAFIGISCLGLYLLRCEKGSGRVRH
jgi:hypothetical protein